MKKFSPPPCTNNIYIKYQTMWWQTGRYGKHQKEAYGIKKIAS
jgi:hypothetical protein